MPFAAGARAWIPDEKVGFLSVTVTSVCSDTGLAEVRIDGAQECRQLPSAELRENFHRDEGCTCSDNTALVFMNDAAILENLRARHAKDEIYTYTASVLLAVNPYKTIGGLYGDEQCARYMGKHIGALPPHPYAIADSAHRALMRDHRDQAVLISGESGAGKTETAKKVVAHLAYASGSQTDAAAHLQDRLLRAQPVLESFGNAVTLRNSNSSRFGKYNQVFFSEDGNLVDAAITTYLLESSRVVAHGDRERNYHVFYEMLSGLDDAKLEGLRLSRDGHYRLLHGATPVEGLRATDAQNFESLCRALATVGLDDEAVDASLRVLAGLVHLGNVPKDAPEKHEDVEGEEAEAVEMEQQSLECAAAMLGMDPDELKGTLGHRRIQIPGRNSFHSVPRSQLQFRQVQQSFVKTLYKRLFERIVSQINASFRELHPEIPEEERGSRRHVGILDIYGFERLQRNSFEQLCINLANERLQQYFVENVLVAEENLYHREGIPWTSLKLPDSMPVVRTVATIFKTLDDFSSRQAQNRPDATDDKFCERIVREAKESPEAANVLKQLKMQNSRRRSQGPSLTDGFVVQHYAGAVTYTTKGWLEKNNDRLLNEVEGLICDSTEALVQSLGEEDRGANPFRSISKKYTVDLDSLLKTLSSCSLHYIRCFKPNEMQKPGMFEKRLVLDQIVQCGTIELVKIMHDGFPNRVGFEELVTRFKSLMPEGFDRYGLRTFIEALMMAYNVPKTEWDLGMSRLFLKAGQLRMLESLRESGASPEVQGLAAIVKGIIQKKWRRAVTAVCFSLWVPRFCESLREQRARKALVVAAHLAGNIAPSLNAARERILKRRRVARRRLKAIFVTVLWTIKGARQHKEKREMRLAVLLRAALFRVRVHRWAVRARSRVAARQLLKAEEEEHLRRVEEARALLAAESTRPENAARFCNNEEEARLAAEREQQLVMTREQQAVHDEETASSTTVGDSVSQVARSFADTEALIERSEEKSSAMEEMGGRVQYLEQRLVEVQRETQAQLTLLMEKNRQLEEQTQQRNQEPRSTGAAPAEPGSEPRAQGRPIGTPPRSEQRLGAELLLSAPRSAASSRRYSLLSLSSKSNRHSISDTRRRRSCAGKGLNASPMQDDPMELERLGSQRKWMKEQRQRLLDDLYPDGVPGTGSAPNNLRCHRMSTGRPLLGDSTARNLATQLDSVGVDAENKCLAVGSCEEEGGGDENRDRRQLRQPKYYWKGQPPRGEA